MAARKNTSKAEVQDVFSRLVIGSEKPETVTAVKTSPEPEQPAKKTKKSFCFRADPEQIRKWKIAAASTGITMEQLCVAAIEEYVSKM